MKNYRGTFSKDMLPIKPKFSESMVINLQDYFAGSGTHWVAMYTDSNQYEYFDPFGVVPPDLVLHYMQKSKKEIIYNSTQVQNISSIMCGYFCVFYIKNRAMGRKPLDILLDYTLFPSLVNEETINNFANSIQ